MGGDGADEELIGRRGQDELVASLAVVLEDLKHALGELRKDALFERLLEPALAGLLSVLGDGREEARDEALRVELSAAVGSLEFDRGRGVKDPVRGEDLSPHDVRVAPEEGPVEIKEGGFHGSGGGK